MKPTEPYRQQPTLQTETWAITPASPILETPLTNSLRQVFWLIPLAHLPGTMLPVASQRKV